MMRNQVLVTLADGTKKIMSDREYIRSYKDTAVSVTSIANAIAYGAINSGGSGGSGGVGPQGPKGDKGDKGDPGDGLAAPTKFYVLAIAGQSNAVGYDESANDMGYAFNVDNNRIRQISCRDSDHLTNNDLVELGVRNQLTAQDMVALKLGVGRNGTKGLHLPLANLIIEHLPKDYGLLIVPCAFGDTGFTRNARWAAPSGNLYQRLVTKVKYCLDLNQENKYLGVVWIQGEADQANAAGHKTGFENMTQSFFTAMQPYASRSVNGVIDKTSWYNVETIYWWYTHDQNRQIWDNYKTWSPSTYVAVNTDSKDSNETNGVYATTGGTAGQVSAQRPSHYGNNAYARKVAPAVFEKMLENGLLGVNRTASTTATVDVDIESIKQEIIAALPPSPGASADDISLKVAQYINETEGLERPLIGFFKCLKNDNQVATWNADTGSLSVSNQTSSFTNAKATGVYFDSSVVEIEFKNTKPILMLKCFGKGYNYVTMFFQDGAAKDYYIRGSNGVALTTVNNNHHTKNFTPIVGRYIKIQRQADGDVKIWQSQTENQRDYQNTPTVNGFGEEILAHMTAEERQNQEFGFFYGFTSVDWSVAEIFNDLKLKRTNKLEALSEISALKSYIDSGSLISTFSAVVNQDNQVIEGSTDYEIRITKGNDWTQQVDINASFTQSNDPVLSIKAKTDAAFEVLKNATFVISETPDEINLTHATTKIIDDEKVRAFKIKWSWNKTSRIKIDFTGKVDLIKRLSNLEAKLDALIAAQQPTTPTQQEDSQEN